MKRSSAKWGPTAFLVIASSLPFLAMTVGNF
jgi:hypothetical protein